MVTIQTQNWTNCSDDIFSGPPDIYRRVTIDGVPQQDAENDSNFSYETGLNLQFTREVDVTRGTIPIVIEQFNSDPGDDQQCQIGQNANAVTLTLDLGACAVGGDVTGTCGHTFTIVNTSVDPNPLIAFKVDVQEPAYAPGLNVRCIHDPIWPQPGQPVSIFVESLDGALTPKLANAVEIWVDNRMVPRFSGAGIAATQVVTPAAGATELNYGCRVVDGTDVAWTGWRKVAVGQPPVVDSYNRKVPISFVAPRQSAIDLVFYHRRSDWALPDNPAFLSQLKTSIVGAFMHDEVFLHNQHKFNFWIALDGGNANGNADTCFDDQLEATNQTYWEDVSVVLHSSVFRDCADPDDHIFSTEVFEAATMRHEAGHAAFGLADEYCCDGGYFQADPLPNVYEESSVTPGELTCQSDAPNVGRNIAECHEWTEDGFWFFDTDWYTSDPASNDIMVDHGEIRALDLRRIEWQFNNCSAASC